MFIIDALQYSNWSEKIFLEMNEAGITAVHVTICYNEDFNEMVQNVIDWNQRFDHYSHLILQGRTAEDVRKAHAEGRTAIFLARCSAVAAGTFSNSKVATSTRFANRSRASKSS